MTTLREVLAAPELAGLTYPEAAAWLAECPPVENPVKEAGLVAKPITRESVIALVPDAEAWAIYAAGAKLIDDLFAAIDTGNREWLAKLLGIAAASGKLSAGTLGELQAELGATVSDPSYSAMIPGAPRWQALGLAAAPSAADVQAACHGG
jgi:hypothetical protein